MSPAGTLNRTPYQSPESANFETPFSSRDALQTPPSSSEYIPPVVTASPEAGNRMARLVANQPAETVPQSPEVAAHQARVEAVTADTEQLVRSPEDYAEGQAFLEIRHAGPAVMSSRRASGVENIG